MKRWIHAPGRVFAILAVAALGLATCGTSARADGPAGGKFDFEQDTQGFQAIQAKDGQAGPDGAAKVTVTHDKNVVKSGSGSLSYEFSVEAKTMHSLFAPVHPPAGSKSIRLWLRSSVPTVVIFTLHQEDGSEYNLAASVPGLEWVQVAACLDELQLSKAGTDPSAKLDPDHIRSISVTDLANLFVNADQFAASLPTGARQLWLDDLEFVNERLPQTIGLVKTDAGNSFLVDNFETGTVRWLPIKITLGDSLSFALFPPDAALRVLAEAAAPGSAKTAIDPGGKGLRCSYHRGPKEAFIFLRNLEHQDLARAARLRLSLNSSAKSTLIVQLKEKGGAEYQHTISPEDSVGWHNLDLALSDFTLSANSKDDDNRLDPDQITELSIIDTSEFDGSGPEGNVNLDLDAVYFVLK